MKLRLAMAAAVLATISVSACGGSEPAAKSPAPSESATSETPTDEATDSETASTDAAASAPITIGKTIKDPLLGHTITVEKVVRNFPIPAAASAVKDRGDELVLVQIKVKVGSKYYISFDEGDFEWTVTGNEFGGQSAASTDVEKAMTAAGHKPLGSIEHGKTGEGWVAGYLNPAGSDKGSIVYRRIAAQGSDGTKIPRKTVPVALPLA